MAAVKSFGEFDDSEVLHIKAFAARIGRKERFVKDNWIDADENPLPACDRGPGMIFISMKAFRLWIEENGGM